MTQRDQTPKEQRMILGMTMGMFWAMIGIGLLAGVASGMFGIGGGAIMVPAMVLILMMDQKLATGTSLGAQILPVGLLAAIEYHRQGQLEINKSVLIALGLLVGAYFGAKITLSLPPATIKRAYGIFLLLIGLRYLFDGWFASAGTLFKR